MGFPQTRHAKKQDFLHRVGKPFFGGLVDHRVFHLALALGNAIAGRMVEKFAPYRRCERPFGILSRQSGFGRLAALAEMRRPALQGFARKSPRRTIRRGLDFRVCARQIRSCSRP
jgi:hypothetical protein